MRHNELQEAETRRYSDSYSIADAASSLVKKHSSPSRSLLSGLPLIFRFRLLTLRASCDMLRLGPLRRVGEVGCVPEKFEL